MLGTTGSPVRINPWSFIGSLGPKNQALAIARDIDAQRGIQLDSSTTSDARVVDTETQSSHSTVRRLPSGAKPPSTGQNIQLATPVKVDCGRAANAHDESMQNVAGQSTPLTQGKAGEKTNGQQENLKNPELNKDCTPRESPRREIFEDVLQLRDEINVLKEVNETQRKSREEMNIELERIKSDLLEKSDELNSLKEIVKVKERDIVSRDKQLKEAQRLLEIKEQERVREIQGFKNKIVSIESEMRKGSDDNITDRGVESIGTFDTSVERMLEELKTKTVKDKTEKDENLKAEILNSNKKIEELGENFKMEKDELQKQHTEELNKLEGLLTESNNIRKDVEDQNAQNIKALSSKEDEMKALKIRMQDLDREKLTLKRSLTESEELLDRLRKDSVGERKEFETKLSDSENVISTLKESFAGENKNLKKRLHESEVLISKLKEDIGSAATTTEEAVHNYEKIQNSFNEEAKSHSSLKHRFKEITLSFDEYRDFMTSLKIFNLELGEVIRTYFEKRHEASSFETVFHLKHEDILGLYTKDQQSKQKQLENNFKRVKEENDSLSNDIEEKWKPQLEEQLQCASKLSCELEDIRKLKGNLESHISELEKKLNATQENKELMITEREAILRTNASLLGEIETMRNATLNENEGKLSLLLNRIEKFAQKISDIQEQVMLESERQQQFNDTIIAKDEKLKDLEEKYVRVDEELLEKSIKLQKIQGDVSKKINFEIAHKSRPDIEKASYANLMIDRVDSIDMVELQNIVKNLILLLEIPFSKLTKKSPLVAIYLKYERPIFSHFANRLHYEIFNEPMDMKGFTNDAYDQYTESHNMTTISHPLESCLDSLYRKITARI